MVSTGFVAPVIMFFHLPSIFLSPVLYSSLILLFSIHRPIIMSTSSNNVLRCNNLKCRSFLSMEGQAVVTTCSHIFCISCATTLFASSLACPACNQSLQEPDDIVMTTLNPTNEYKASILAGLPPSTILEVTARAISFWTYQLSQESACQALILKNAQDRQVCTEKQLNNAFEDLQSR